MPLEAIAPGLVRRSRTLSPLLRYPLAGALTYAAFLARLTLLRDWLPDGLPFLNLFLSTLLSASLFGRGPGLFSVGLGVGLVAYFITPPLASFQIANPKQLAALVLFSCIAGLMVLTIARLQDALRQVREGEDHLRLLLREFRHRTRNDLHSLVGLLLLRARGAKSEEARDGLKEAANHALSLARVHTRLATATPGLGEEAVIDTHGFICGLVDDMRRTAEAKGLRPVAVHAAAESHRLNNERAVQLGLVLNELVAASLRRSFPAESGGTLSVRFIRDGDDYLLTIEDDGEVWLLDADHGDGGLGTRLLRALASQLRGRLTREGGLAQLRFPVAVPTMLPMPAAA